MKKFCRLVREITGDIRAPHENLCYTASAIPALQVDLFKHYNILAIHAKWVTILPSDMHMLKRVAQRFNLDKHWIKYWTKLKCSGSGLKIVLDYFAGLDFQW